jgi:LacI family transcriptional regulator
VVVAAGHRRIAFIAGESRAWATGRRVAGYRNALAEAGVSVDDELILYGNFRADSGYELTRTIISRRERPTAILCGNDLMALGAYFAVKEMGMRVPDDVSVMGYDDQEDLAADLSPPLSTVRLPFYEMGRWAAEHIVAASVDQLPPMTFAACPVVERASIAAPSVG